MNEPIVEQLARCDREIAAMREQDANKPAWLVALGISDWERERALILQEDALRSAVAMGSAS